jgi:phage terminase large subunit
VSDALARARENVKRWRASTRAFAWDNFRFEPDAWQGELFDAFDDPAQSRISLQACVGPGKTAGLAICAWKFMSCYGERGEHPKGAAVSVTESNLNDNLWPELAKWQGRSAFLSEAFTWTKTRVFANDHPETWFLSARSWPKTATPDEQGKTLSGLHSKFVLVLVDESGTIPETILRAGEQALSNAQVGKMVQAGNPSSLDGMLYAAATRLRHLWRIIRVTGDPDDPKRSPRIDMQWAKDQIANYGRDNPWVMSSILGMFPPASINALLGVEEVEAAMKRHLRADQYDHAQKRLGVDVARFGDDRTVIFPRQGLASFMPVVMRNARTTDIAARVAKGMVTWGAELALVDDTGHWGHGVIDNLVTAGFPAVGIQFHGKALDPRYRNRRAEMWIKGAEAIKGGAALPPMPELVGELVTPTYTFVNGVFLLEDKDLIKQRLGRSPDLADAYMLTYAMEEAPNAVLERIRGASTALHDFDPFNTTPGGQAARDVDPFTIR